MPAGISEIEEPLLNSHDTDVVSENTTSAVGSVEDYVDAQEEQLKEVEHTLFASGFNCHITRPVAHLLAPSISGLPEHAATGQDGKPPEKIHPVKWGRLLALARPEWKWISGGLLALVLRLPFNLAMPHYISMAISHTLQAVNTRDAALMEEVKVNIMRFFMVALANAVLDFFNWNFFVVSQQRIIRRMRSRFFRSLLDQEISFFDSQSTGNLISRLTSDIGEMANDLTWVFRWSLEAVVRVGGISIYLFWVSWQLALLAWIVAPIIAIINRFYGNWLNKKPSRDAHIVRYPIEGGREHMPDIVRTVTGGYLEGTGGREVKRAHMVHPGSRYALARSHDTSRCLHTTLRPTYPTRLTLVLGVAPNDRIVSDPPCQAYSYVLRPAGGGQITRGYPGLGHVFAGCGVDAKGCGMDAKGCGMDAKGCGMDAKGSGVDAKGYMVDAKGCDVDDKGCGVDAKGYGVDANRVRR
eukprot:1185018-Prorocentrum_minimum.AAC.3